MGHYDYMREADQFDGRIMLAAGFLASRVPGKIILDLNCGYAPILRYLPKTFASYLGNDLDLEAMAFCRANYERAQVQFVHWDDTAMRDRTAEILLAFGYACNPDVPHRPPHASRDSATLDDTIRRIVSRCQPEIVVLDQWLGVSEGVRERFVTLQVDLKLSWGYRLHAWRVRPVIERDRCTSREVIICERS